MATITGPKKERCRNCAMATGTGDCIEERAKRRGSRLYCDIWDVLVKPSYWCLCFSEPAEDNEER